MTKCGFCVKISSMLLTFDIKHKWSSSSTFFSILLPIYSSICAQLQSASLYYAHTHKHTINSSSSADTKARIEDKARNLDGVNDYQIIIITFNRQQWIDTTWMNVKYRIEARGIVGDMQPFYCTPQSPFCCRWRLFGALVESNALNVQCFCAKFTRHKRQFWEVISHYSASLCLEFEQMRVYGVCCMRSTENDKLDMFYANTATIWHLTKALPSWRVEEREKKGNLGKQIMSILCVCVVCIWVKTGINLIKYLLLTGCLTQ